MVTSDGGKIVGLGEVRAEGLVLTLEPGFAGFAVLVLQGPDDSLTTFEAVVEGDGDILIEREGDFADIRDTLSEAGLAYRMTVGGDTVVDHDVIGDSDALDADLGSADSIVGGRAADAVGEGGRPTSPGDGRAGAGVERLPAVDAAPRPAERTDDRAAEGLGRAVEAGSSAEETRGTPDEAGNRPEGAGRGAPGVPAGTEDGPGAGAPEGPADAAIGAGGRVGNGRD